MGTQLIACAAAACVRLTGRKMLMHTLSLMITAEAGKRHRRNQHNSRGRNPKNPIFHKLIPFLSARTAQLLISSFCVTMLQYSMLPIS